MLPAEFLIVLLALVAVLARAANALGLPYPVFLVLGGLAVGLVPGLPRVELQPDLVLLIFLPPLVYYSAFLMSPRDLRAHAKDIAGLSIGLVLITMGLVAVVAHELVGHLSWAESFALGAIISPTDPLASTAIFRRLGASQRLTAIIEGESLINDGTALVAFRVAVGAIGAGSFSLASAGWHFVASAVGGAAIGLAAGWVISRIRERIDDPPVEITLSLFTPYLAYLPAEHAGASGVLAAVTTGLYIGFRAPAGMFTATTRLQASAFWDILVFQLNALLFLLVGLQFHRVLDALGKRSAEFLLASAALVAATVLVTRMVWFFVAGGLAKSKGERIVLGWSGMRGAVSLAAALSIPLDAPGRPLILFLTFATILVTLVGQGLTLPALVRRFAPADTRQTEEVEERARLHATEAALERLERLAKERDIPAEAFEHARRRYELRRSHLSEEAEHEEGEPVLPAARGVQREALAAEREALERMFSEGEIDSETARRLERELDLEEERWARLEESPLA
jgi:CPA1 family monovalent cation:H+ antiporter